MRKSNFKTHDMTSIYDPISVGLGWAVSRGFVSLDDTDVFGSYVREVESGYCPFLRKSILARQCLKTVYRFQEEDLIAFEQLMFFICMDHVQHFRSVRKRLSAEAATLYCENILITGVPAEKAPSGTRIAQWIYWIAKLLYSSDGIIFGEFWKGEAETSVKSGDLPIPPIHFLSIRSFHDLDKRFLASTPGLTEPKDERISYLRSEVEESLPLVERNIRSERAGALYLRFQSLADELAQEACF